MNKEAIRKIIWDAVRNHFTLKDNIRLDTDLKYEKNKTIAQVAAIGLCHQYDIEPDTVQKILCINPVGYKNKLQTFKDAMKNNDAPDVIDEDVADFKRRFSMCSRYVRRRTEPRFKV